MFASTLASYLVAAVLAAGIVLAIARWRRNPRTALLVIIALGLPLVFDFSLVYLYRLPTCLRWLSAALPSERRLIFGVREALAQTARAASCVLFLIAAFRRGGDNTAQPEAAVGQRTRPPGLAEKWFKAGGVSPE
jgi:hypothetical protein